MRASTAPFTQSPGNTTNHKPAGESRVFVLFEFTKTGELKMGFKILSPRGFGVKANARDFRIAFGNKNKLPNKLYMTTAMMNGWMLWLKPPIVGELVPKHTAVHRVFVKCPTCGNMVPAGRTTQHRCDKKFDLYWAPEGYRYIASVVAKSHSAAKRKAPMPYRKYLGEIEARG